MTGYCDDCGNQACICPVPVPADHHPTDGERLALCRLGRPHEFGSTGWCVCGEPAAPAVPVRELIAEVIADRDRLAARVAALEAAGMDLAAWAGEQTHDIHDAGHRGDMARCDRPRCQQTTRLLDAWDRALAGGGGEEGQG